MLEYNVTVNTPFTVSWDYDLSRNPNVTGFQLGFFQTPNIDSIALSSAFGVSDPNARSLFNVTCDPGVWYMSVRASGTQGIKSDWAPPVKVISTPAANPGKPEAPTNVRIN